MRCRLCVHFCLQHRARRLPLALGLMLTLNKHLTGSQTQSAHNENKVFCHWRDHRQDLL